MSPFDLDLNSEQSCEFLRGIIHETLHDCEVEHHNGATALQLQYICAAAEKAIHQAAEIMAKARFLESAHAACSETGLLRQRVEELEDALRPFAEMKLHSAVPDSWSASTIPGITAGHIRAARAVLEKLP